MDEEESNRRITELARRIPTLRAFVASMRSWNADLLDQWAVCGRSHGEKCAAQFILAVWNPGHEWISGRFDVMEALRIWDDAHRAAFLAWAEDPWWA